MSLATKEQQPKLIAESTHLDLIEYMAPLNRLTNDRFHNKIAMWGKKHIVRHTPTYPLSFPLLDYFNGTSTRIQETPLMLQKKHFCFPVFIKYPFNSPIL